METKIAILGSGGMGTACAILLAGHAGQTVALWARTAERARNSIAIGKTEDCCPACRFPREVEITHRSIGPPSGAELFVVAIPTKYLRETLAAISRNSRKACPPSSVAKGLEMGTLMRPSEMIVDVLGPRDVVAVGGPSHAEEIARQMPASVVAASDNAEFARRVQ